VRIRGIPGSIPCCAAETRSAVVEVAVEQVHADGETPRGATAARRQVAWKSNEIKATTERVGERPGGTTLNPTYI